MFIETYYDERAWVPTSGAEPAILYPELRGEDLTVWQRYLPARREIECIPWWLYESAPDPVIREIQRAKEMRLFERIEIWSRTDDPMVVGIIGGYKPRYFSIVRWGDAKLTLEQVRKRLRMREWIFRLAPAGALLAGLAIAFAHLVGAR
jgi:hypothetical protein